MVVAAIRSPPLTGSEVTPQRYAPGQGTSSAYPTFEMELKQLRVLQAVGETGSFSAAADRLDYMQPAVSKIVATLERQLGTTLVDHGIRPLRLTEAGSVLAQRAAAAFEQLAAAELEVEAIANLSAGSLDDPFDVVVPRGHRLERNQIIRFADLSRESWLLGDFGADSPSFRMIDRRCRDAGFEPHVAYRVNDCQMAQALVAAGEGIALLPRLMLRVKHSGVAIRPLATDPPARRVSALRLATRYLTPATERFLALLVAASADEQLLSP